MNTPIVITASGTTPAALATYNQLDRAIRSHFIENEILWGYSARISTKKPQVKEDSIHPGPEVVMRQLAARGITRVLVQSLHLLPGSEFHDLQRTIRHPEISCVMGMPLLTSPGDYDALGEILRPTIAARPAKAILLLGHGTTHPTWTAYCCLEKILRRKFDERIFVGVLEKFPDSSTLPAEIRAAGFHEVCIIPFLFIAGMHYQRDIVGDGPTSWMTRLRANNLEVEAISHGLGLFPGVAALIIRHIAEAMQSFDGR